MSTIKGLDKLMKKLESLTDLDTQTIVEDCGEKLRKSIQNEAREFSDEEYQYILKGQTKIYNSNSASIQVGLLNTEANFEDYKGLYFNNYGFELWKNGKYYAPHIGWFYTAVENAKKEIITDMKEQLKNEIKKKVG